MHRPYTILSRYTARMPIRNSSVEPEALNSGLSTAMIKITGSCQRSAPSVRAAPRVANPYASPPASDSANQHRLHREHGEPQRQHHIECRHRRMRHRERRDGLAAKLLSYVVHGHPRPLAQTTAPQHRQRRTQAAQTPRRRRKPQPPQTNRYALIICLRYHIAPCIVSKRTSL